MKSFKVPKAMKSFIHSENVLYMTVLVAVVNILGYMMSGCTVAVVFFALSAMIVSRFNKNMVVVLGGSLILTNLFVTCKVAKETFVGGREGMKDGKDGGDGDADGDMKTSTDLPDMDDMPDLSGSGSGSGSGEDEAQCKKKKGYKWEEDKCVAVAGVEPIKEGNSTFYKKDSRVDYAATVEDAYGDLDKILGGDGIKNLSNDTAKLVKQQQQLAGLMKNMGPMVGQVKSMMGSMGGAKGMQDMLASATQKFSGGGGQ